ncbi:hypothetical protein [Amphritea japonica]|uniref:hypothetical protein n=1 Tax=Amphritea japonica TaxID=452627 RepID=UPI0003A79017|nr:hypothetical protein [Amphritea japonica]
MPFIVALAMLSLKSNRISSVIHYLSEIIGLSMNTCQGVLLMVWVESDGSR